MFGYTAVLTELLDRKSAARLRGDALAPLVAPAGGGLFLHGTVGHTPTMPRAAKFEKRGSSDAYVKNQASDMPAFIRCAARKAAAARIRCPTDATIEVMGRCWVLFCCLAAACFAEGPGIATVRGTLVQRAGAPPAIETPDHHVIFLDGDEPTKGVLNDKRLAGFDLEAKGISSRRTIFRWTRFTRRRCSSTRTGT